MSTSTVTATRRSARLAARNGPVEAVPLAPVALRRSARIASAAVAASEARIASAVSEAGHKALIAANTVQLPIRPAGNLNENDLSTFYHYAKSLIQLCESSNNKEHKIQYVTELFDFCLQNHVFHSHDRLEKLRQTVKDKCREISKKEKENPSPFMPPLRKVIRALVSSYSLYWLP